MTNVSSRHKLTGGAGKLVAFQPRRKRANKDQMPFKRDYWVNLWNEDTGAS